MASDDDLPTEDLRTGARLYSVIAAAGGVGSVFARPPWKYLCVAIAVVCFCRSVYYFWKLRKRP